MRYRNVIVGLALASLLVSIAYAATSSDPAMPGQVSNLAPTIGGYQIGPGVDQLRWFGIVKGDPDGNLRLGDSITREELAKVVVVAMGQEQAAVSAATEPPAFNDVADRWSRGCIAVAKRLGVVNGYGDGSFRPRNPVQNAEALAMVLRASGLQPSGAWPDAFYAAARNTGVLDTAMQQDLPPQQYATRGGVFFVADRAFSKVLVQGKNLFQRSFGQPAPTLTVGLPDSPSGVTSAASIRVTITAPKALLVAVNGIPAVSNGSQFTAQVPLKLGANDIFVLATDDLGQEAQKHLTVTRN